MTTVHIARAVGSTESTAAKYRVDVRVGAHQLIADEPVAAGGGDLGPSPFGLLLSGLVACTAMTLRMYAARKGWELATIEVEVRYDADLDGRRVIERTITVPVGLSEQQRARLADIAERTPVTLAIREGTPITTTFQTHDD
ncbi:MAG: OsmC family protein [Ilumatobacteraceae bacterium]|nr:OsmC family protein [Ilumatobacteraceae bacterium]